MSQYQIFCPKHGLIKEANVNYNALVATAEQYHFAVASCTEILELRIKPQGQQNLATYGE